MKTYGSLEFDHRKEEWVVQSCEPHVAIRLKKIFPRLKVTSTAPFRFNDEPDTCADLEWFSKRYPLKIQSSDSDRLRQRRALFERDQAEIERIFLPSHTPKISTIELKPGCAFRGYQKTMMELVQRVRRLLVVDDIGLGKTYEAIGVMLANTARPTAVVVQTHLPKQWEEKINEFCHLKVHQIRSRAPYDLPAANIYVFKYSQIAGWTDIFAERFFHTVVFDEIQELRTGSASLKGVAAKKLADNVEIVVGLSATPIYNYGNEIFNIGEVIRPGVLGTREEFMREWCDGNDRVVADPEALGSYLREAHFMLRRTRKDVGQEMKPVNRIVETVAYDEKAVADAEKIAEQLAVRTITGTFFERGRAARELDIFAREMTGISKAAHVAHFVRMLLESGEPVLLVGWHRDVIRKWLHELQEFNPVMYTGSESGAKKIQSKDAFINGETNLMIISLRSGVGLDGLQHRCSTVVIGELDWSPKVHEQIIGRVDREGQMNPVMAIYLVSEYGSDPVIIDLLGLKNSQADSIVDPGQELVTVEPDKARLRLLAERFLSKRKRDELHIESDKKEDSQLQIAI